MKNTAGWWATDAISETEFVNAVEFLVKENIIQVNASQTSETSQSVPEWVKNTAGWWANNQISDGDFVNSIQYLISVGIMIIPQDENVLTDSSAIKSSYSILDTTSFFEVVVDHSPEITPKNPETFSKNSEGFRGPEFNKDKPDNTYRIIAVGGSTTSAGPRIVARRRSDASFPLSQQLCAPEPGALRAPSSSARPSAARTQPAAHAIISMSWGGWTPGRTRPTLVCVGSTSHTLSPLRRVLAEPPAASRRCTPR